MNTSKLDIVMPNWYNREIHKINIPIIQGDIMNVVENLTWSDVSFFRMTINFLSFKNKKKSDEKILDLFTKSDLYKIIHRSTEELILVGVLPLADKSYKLKIDKNDLRGFQLMERPKTVKVAMNFLYRDGVLSTETRNLPTGQLATVLFTMYWTFIRIGSGLIRKSWLKGVNKKVIKK